MKRFSCALLFIISINFTTQASETNVSINTDTGVIHGTLLSPQSNTSQTVALIIAGSGPTDRNGNNPAMQNNSLKLLAKALADNNIASLRYDKRGVASSAKAGLAEEDLRFEHYIDDAKQWVSYLDKQQFKQIIVIGHSEGSLIGMVVSQMTAVDKFISIAGAGQPIDKILRQQLAAQPAFVAEMATPILDKLLQGERVSDVPLMLASLFRESVQPYLISWFKYHPQVEIAKLDKPVLLVQGTTDIQVDVKEAQKLKHAKPDAELAIIAKMNHIFKQAPNERTENLATYSQPALPIVEEMTDAIVTFILD